jgi:hypothetical protein
MEIVNVYVAFEHVVFTINDWSDKRRFIDPFEKGSNDGKMIFPLIVT